MREIKFRAWDHIHKEMVHNVLEIDQSGFGIKTDLDETAPVMKARDFTWLQYTGLKDKNGDNEIYECDIIDSDGNVIGNQYETPALLEEKANLLIQGFGTKTWLTTYQKAMERGCYDAQ